MAMSNYVIKIEIFPDSHFKSCDPHALHKNDYTKHVLWQQKTWTN